MARMGANRFIPKPFAITDLVDSLRSVIDEKA